MKIFFSFIKILWMIIINTCKNKWEETDVRIVGSVLSIAGGLILFWLASTAIVKAVIHPLWFLVTGTILLVGPAVFIFQKYAK